MHVLVPVLLALAALGMVVSAWVERAKYLGRLRRLVDAGRGHADAGGETEAMPGPGHFLPHGVARRLRLLGIELDRGNAGIVLAACALVIMVTVRFAGPLAALVLASAMLLAGLMVLNILAARRVAELGALMPGFFDRVRQLLAVGNSLPTAFVRAVQGAQPRLAVFFGSAVRRMGNGASVAESIQQCAEDIDLYEMRLFAAAVATNMRFGGSLSHSLSNLISFLRKRAGVERELRANTAQIRAGAWVLGLLPMAVAGLIVFQNPDYARWFITHPTGKLMLVYCIFSQMIGAFLMRMIVRTKF